MEDANEQEITDLEIGSTREPLSGSREAVNEMLDFCMEHVCDYEKGLERLRFDSWTESIRVIEPEILTLFAAKSS